MAIQKRKAERTVVEEHDVLVCDGCGTEAGSTGPDSLFHPALPDGWYRIAAPNRQLYENHIVACSKACAIKAIEASA